MLARRQRPQVRRVVGRREVGGRLADGHGERHRDVALRRHARVGRGSGVQAADGGAVGYVSYTGNLDLAIAIRTLVMQGDTIYVQAGAGLVADVSPSPAAQILINYLFDIDPITTSPILQVFVGDPDNPPPGFVACPPSMSRNTLFGLTPDGTPLITSPDPLPDELQPFRFEFTSRPDANGERHTQVVEATAQVAAIDLERVGLPAPIAGGPDTAPGLLPPSPAEPPQFAGIGAPSTGTGSSAGKATWPVAVAIAGALIVGLGWAVASRKGH